MSLLVTLILVGNLCAQPSPGGSLPAGYWTAEQANKVLGATRTIRLAPDLSHLSAGERAALSKLMEVGGIFQRLFEEQKHPEALGALANLQALNRERKDQHSGNLLKLYRMFSGPVASIAETNTREPFLPTAGNQPGRNVYPWAITKDEINQWLKDNPEQRSAILGPRTAVRRADTANLAKDIASLERHPVLDVLHPGLLQQLRVLASAPNPKSLYAVPYAVAYADQLVRAYLLTTEAASLIAPDDAELAGYLRNRARDLLSNDYEPGDASWVTGSFKNLNVVMGPYEAYLDELFGIKTFFGLSILVERKQETAVLQQALNGLQQLEDAMPYARHKRLRDNTPAGFYDVVADFGDARGTNTALILPNDSSITRRYGRRIIMRSNIIREEQSYVTLAWKAVVAPAHYNQLTAEGETQNTVWHEVGHYLGVDRTQDGRPLNDALEDAADLLEELKADLTSLFVGPILRQRSYYTDEQLKSVYASGIMRGILKSKPRRDQPYETMQLMQMNFFRKNGVLAFDPASATLTIRFENYPGAVEQMLKQTLALQYAGDKDAAERFIAEYTEWDEALHGVIAKKYLSSVAHTLYGLIEYDVLDR
jgi:hypothetical protein